MISFEVGKRYAEIDEYLTEYLDFKNRVEISNQKVANAMQADDARFNRFVETLRAA